jgi:uncharacterized phage protein (TIGR02220 family)/predicted phage replisome organizer
MAEIKWIKITTNMFDNRKIKHLRRLPDGNNIVLIWVMLLTMAGRCNSGGMIFLTENIPYTSKMLADELDFEETTVQLALKALEQLNMIVTDQGFFTIAGWEEYQNTEGLDKIREQNRIRKQRQRESQKSLPDVSRDSHVTVTQCHATEEDKEKDIDIDKDIYISIISYLNEKAGTGYKPTTAKTKSAIKARLSEGFKIDDFKTVIDKKCSEWLGDPKMEKYLRPETLFGTKFEGYLNARVSKQTTSPHQGYHKQTKAEELDQFYHMAAQFGEGG